MGSLSSITKIRGGEGLCALCLLCVLCEKKRGVVCRVFYLTKTKFCYISLYG